MSSAFSLRTLLLSHSHMPAGVARLALALHPRSLLDGVTALISGLVLGLGARFALGKISTNLPLGQTAGFQEFASQVLPKIQHDTMLDLLLPFFCIFMVLRVVLQVAPQNPKHILPGLVRGAGDLAEGGLGFVISCYPLIVMGFAAWELWGHMVH